MKSKKEKRVVVTGIGVVSSVGIGRHEFWHNLLSGKCGISEVTAFDVSSYEMKRGGQVKNFDASQFITKKKFKEMARASQFAVSASIMALNDAGLEKTELPEHGTAVIFGTTMGEGGMIEEADKHWTSLGEGDVWALTISKYPCNAIADHVTRYLKLKGVSMVLPNACAAGNYSIGYGFDLIRTGVKKYAIVGGSDPFSRIGFTGFGRLYAMSPDLCRPFDKNRKGMMVGEGAGAIILEELENAEKRGAEIYAEVLGYGLSCDAFHMTAPRKEGIVKVMEKAIKNSGIKKNDVGYISAHGTGTPANDKTECEAINEVFGDRAKDILVSSIKSMLGHTMGAASAIEAIACALAVKKGKVPPTINYETPDPECDIDCVPNEARDKNIKVALNNSFAFGGNNACLAVGKYEG